MRTLTACTLDCPDACSLVVDIDAAGRIRIEGNPAHPFTAGFTCAKIKRFGERLRHPDRITTPLLRTDGGWHPLSWDSALDLCAERIQRYRGEPASILHVRSGADQGVLRKFGDAFFGRLGASELTGSLCDSAGAAACRADFGSAAVHDPADLLNAHTIVNWGKDLSRMSVHLAHLVAGARKRGVRVISISPGGDDNSAFSDEVIRIRPGTDRFLAAALMRLFVERGIPANLDDHTVGWEVFRQVIAGRGAAEWAAPTGLPMADVERLYACYAQSEPVATLIGQGLQRITFGGEAVRFINALVLISGHIGQAGGGSLYWQTVSANVNMDWSRVTAAAPRRSFPLPLIASAILGAEDPPIRMLWVQCTNIVNQAADSRAIARAFDAVEFKVVVDAFMNDTSERADLILPTVLNLEKEDLVGSCLHPYVNYARPAIPPPDGARTDAWILSALGRRLDPPVEMPEPEDVLRGAIQSPYLDITWDEMRANGFARSNRPPVVYEGLRFDHADGRYHFPTEIHEQPPAPEGYPLQLLSLARRQAIHSQMAPEQQTVPPTVWISPSCPAGQALDLTRPVYLASPLGRLAVRVQILPDLHPDVVVYRRGDWMKLGGGVNQLIAAQVTDMGHSATFYSQFVRLEN